MDEKTKRFNFTVSVLFIGLLSFFGLFYLLTATLDSFESASGDGFFLNKPGYSEKELLSGYNDAVFKNNNMLDTITVMDYLLFGRINSEEILLGKDEFLFEIKDANNGFGYLADYIGENDNLHYVLKDYAAIIDFRQRVYESRGIYYVFAVIPNCQTVYYDKMPDYLGEISDNTRLSQLSDYMNLFYPEVNYIDLTDAYLAEKKTYRLYNNTENSISAYGGFIAYREICSSVPDYLMSPAPILTSDDISFYTRSVYGKSLSSRLGLSKHILNHTVALTDDTVFRFGELALYSGLEITIFNKSNIYSAADYPSVLIDYTNDWNKLQTLPFFSNTFRVAGYKNDHSFSEFALEKVEPAIVIQFIGENELDLILSGKVEQSFHDGLKKPAK